MSSDSMTRRSDPIIAAPCWSSGAVYADERLDGVLSCHVHRDGANATKRLAGCIRQSRFYPQLHAVLLQGIAFAGFNAVDIHALSARLVHGELLIKRRSVFGTGHDSVLAKRTPQIPPWLWKLPTEKA
jgi:Protein of unknown function DUF99